MILIDTHVLIWWLKGGEKLSVKAKKAIKKEEVSGEVCISSISMWETAMLVKEDKIDIAKDFEEWIKDLKSVDFLRFVPVDNKIAIESVFLPKFKHKDPADRIIVATAKELDCPLVTSDKKLLNYPHIKTIW